MWKSANSAISRRLQTYNALLQVANNGFQKSLHVTFCTCQPDGINPSTFPLSSEEFDVSAKPLVHPSVVTMLVYRHTAARFHFNGRHVMFGCRVGLFGVSDFPPLIVATFVEANFARWYSFLAT